MEAASARLQQAIEYLKDNGKIHKQQDIADALGMAKTHLSVALRGGKYFTEGFLRRFAKAYSDYINEDWLLTGEGRMEKVDQRSVKIHIPSDKAVVAAGFVGAAISSVQEGECEMRPVMAPFPWYDFTITVKGDSMQPMLFSGDVIACEWQNGDIDFKDSKIYVIDTDGGAVVKRVKRKGDTLICHSDNPDYADFSVSLTENMRIARVVGVVREL